LYNAAAYKIIIFVITKIINMKNLQKNSRPLNMLSAFCLLSITMLLSSCEAIAGIFKAGMGVGIFIVVAIVLIIVFFVMRAGKNSRFKICRRYSIIK
jgi:predicted Abi (CAAX) family protease